MRKTSTMLCAAALALGFSACGQPDASPAKEPLAAAHDHHGMAMGTPMRHDMGSMGHDMGHDMGSMAMPAMMLSESVEARVTPLAPLAAGQPGTLRFRFESRASRAALTDFEVAHERRLHVFVVSDDMSFFAHVHPTLSDAEAGLWTLEQTFPAPGRYQIYADFKSTGAGANVTRSDLVVAGTPPAAVPLTVDGEMTKTFGGLTVTARFTPWPLTTGDTLLTYRVTDESGQPVTDLAPYLGAFGHLFALSSDKVTMAHAHPEGAAPTADAHGGPEISFHTRFPSAGTYKLWAQVLRGGIVTTTDWTVAVH